MSEVAISQDAELASSEDLRRLREQVPDNWALCNFAGKCEREYMIASTIHACCLNAGERGEPFSFRSSSMFRNGPHADNSQSYQWLLDELLIVEETRLAADVNPPDDIPVDRDGNVTVIFCTQTLVDRLDRFFAKKSR